MREEIRHRFAQASESFAAEARAMRSQLIIPPPVDVVDWIEANVVLSKDSSAEGGNTIKLYGYQKSIARIALHPKTKDLAVVKGTRTGLTQEFTAIMAYHVAYEGSPCAVYQPTDQKAQKFGNSYWAPMFRDSPKLQPFMRNPQKGEIQDRWNEIIYANGGKMYLNFATSDDQFAGDTIRVVAGDEPDRWKTTTGGSDGDKLALMRERYRTFWNGKSYVYTSPRMMGTSVIWKEWLESDQRYFNVRCPCCSEVQHLVWSFAKGEPGITYDVDAKGNVTHAYYVCIKGCVLDESAKFAMDEEAGNAVYAEDDTTPTHQRLGFQPTKIPERPGLIGMHVPGYMSLAPGADWKTLCQEWVNAQGRPKKLQTFWNNVLGLPWEGVDSRAVIEVGSFEAERPQCYDAEVPWWVLHLVGFYDTQQGWLDKLLRRPPRHEFMIAGFGPQDECAVIGYFILDDYPIWSAQANAQIDHIATRAYRKSDGTALRPIMIGYDASFSQSRAMEFRRAKHRMRLFWPMKGDTENKITHAGEAKPIVSRAKTADAQANDLIKVSTPEAKAKADRMLQTTAEGAGFVHFPKSLLAAVPDFFKMLFSERLITDEETGDTWWVKKTEKAANEAWDCLCGCIATLELAKLTYPNQVGRAIDDAPIDTTRQRYAGPDRSVMAEIVEMTTMREIRKTPGTSLIPSGMTGQGAPVQRQAPPPQQRRGMIGRASGLRY